MVIVAAVQARAASTPSGGSTGTSTSSTTTGMGSGGPGPLSAVPPPPPEPQRSKEIAQMRDALQRLHADQRSAVERATVVATKSSDPQVRQYAEQVVKDQQAVDAQLVKAAHASDLALSGSAYTAEEQRLHGSLPPSSEDEQQFLSGAQTLAQSAAKNAGELAKVAEKRDDANLVAVAQQAEGSHASSLAAARSLGGAGTTGTGSTGGKSDQ
jgi:hypothetical protein